MHAAWARVVDYRVRVEVRTYKDNGSFDTQKSLYTFKKPDRIRLDLERPHPGMVLIFPDKEGKVFVKPSGIGHLFHFDLRPDSRLLTGSSPQRIDQTDMGLLIRHISHDLTDGRLGPAEVTEEDGSIIIHVRAMNHFRPDTVTWYRFFIDRATWLPAGVEESTPEGRLERTVAFKDLAINIGAPDSLFQTEQ
jgi:outer membrane lipoprotein-sorting protein